MAHQERAGSQKKHEYPTETLTSCVTSSVKQPEEAQPPTRQPIAKAAVHCMLLQGWGSGGSAAKLKRRWMARSAPPQTAAAWQPSVPPAAAWQTQRWPALHARLQQLRWPAGQQPRAPVVARCPRTPAHRCCIALSLYEMCRLLCPQRSPRHKQQSCLPEQWMHCQASGLSSSLSKAVNRDSTGRCG